MMDEKILEVFRNNKKGYVSGEGLSKSLGVSRAAIWKHIQGLRDEGYQIEAQPHWGYRLVDVPDKLLPLEINWQLGTKVIGKKVHSYEQVDSTMDIAHSLAAQGAEEGTLVFAETQTKGRGRIGRTWVSPKGKGIYLSLILRPEILPNQAPMLTLLAAVSVAKVIRKVLGLSALIKWPNDILINNRKICGILTEMNAEVNRIKFLVLGIGINVNIESSNLPKGATSLSQIKGGEISRIDLAKGILRGMDKCYLLFKQQGFSPIIKEWKDLSAVLGTRVKVMLQDKTIEGQAQDLDNHGALILRLDSGFLEKVVAGDVVRVR